MNANDSGQGPPLVLLHGWAASAGTWAPLLSEWQPARRCLRPALPGHGAGPASELDSAAIIDSLSALAGEPADWVGWSLGGLLGLALAAQRPRQVRRLVLIAAGPSFVARAGWPWAMEGALLERFRADLEDDPAGLLKRFMALQCQGDARAAALLRDLRRASAGRPQPTLAGLRWGLEHLRDLDLTEAVRRLDVPALFVFGGADRLVPVAAAQHLADLNPRVEVATIATAAHLPHCSHPRELAELLERFLA